LELEVPAILAALTLPGKERYPLRHGDVIRARSSLIEDIVVGDRNFSVTVAKLSFFQWIYLAKA
jgi:hypothetical protein